MANLGVILHSTLLFCCVLHVKAFIKENHWLDRNSPEAELRASPSSSLSYNSSKLVKRSTGIGSESEKREGPKFVSEPSNKVIFSNSTGIVVNCKAKGNPPPEIVWQHSDGSKVTDISGLRHSLPDGSLLFHPFPASQYTQSVHAAIYRCLVSNIVGKILSRNVHLRAVVQQAYKTQVHDVFVLKENSAIFHCSVPNFVRDFVEVIAWYKDNKALITSSSPKGFADRFTLLHNGDLYIRNASLQDMGSYSCEIRNQLTGETMRSSLNGQLKVTEPTGLMAPRIVYSTSSMLNVKQGSSLQICCIAQANPIPNFSWIKEDKNSLTSPVTFSDSIYPSNGCLTIHHASIEHSAKYICQANNIAGDERSIINLDIESPLLVSLAPSLMILDIGKAIQFRCTVVTSRGEISILWLKDGQPISSNDSESEYRQINRTVKLSTLTIDSVNRHHAGTYQCFAENEQESGQATSELQLSDIVPNLVDVFGDMIVHPKESVVMRCMLNGSPLPRIKWSRDGQLLSDSLFNHESSRIRTGDHVNSEENIVGYLNITRVEIVDEGEYKCQGENDVGSVEHAARLYVIGPPRLKSKERVNLVLVAGKDATVLCPIAGYPIDPIRWEFKEQVLPINHRQKIELLSSKDHRSALRIENIQKHHDEGEYKCTVKVPNSESLKANIMLTVKVAPHIDVQPLPDLIYTNEGMRVKLVCSVVEGDPPLHIKWLKDDKILPLSGNILLQNSDDYSLLTFKKVTFRDSGNYTCHAKNSIAHDSRTSRLTVNVPPKWIIEPANETSIVYGSSVSINCSSDGYPPARISWKKSLTSSSPPSIKHHHGSIDTDPSNFKDILSSYRHKVYANGTLVIQEADRSDLGSYMCQVNNEIGAGLSKVVKLKVLMPPHFENKFISVTSIKGEKSALKCEPRGDDPMKIIWQKDKQPISFKSEKRYSLIENRNELMDNVVSLLEIQQTDRLDSALYTCQASNGYGSDDTNIQLIVLEHPEPPIELEVVDSTSRSARLRWKAPFHGNSPIKRYFLEFTKTSSEDWTQLEIPNLDLDYFFQGLNPVSKYKVRIRAENEVGISDPSVFIILTTGEEVPGGPPQDLRLEASGAQSLKVRWMPPKKELQFGKVKGYYIGYRVAEHQEPYNYKNVEIEDDRDVETEMSTYITNLRRRTTYEVVIQAYNAIGTGPRSDEIRMTTLQNSPPTTPNVHLIGSTFDSITIGWNTGDAGSNEDEGSDHRSFIICFKPETNYDWTKVEISQVSTNKHKIVNLKCGTKYMIYMIAKNTLGIGEPSKTITARTKGGAPISPSSLSNFATINATWIHLNLGKWLDSGCPIQNFFIRHKSKSIRQWAHVNKLASSLPKSVTINNLQPGIRYNLIISASSDAGITEAEYDFETYNLTNTFLYSFATGHTKNSGTTLISEANTSTAQYLRQYLTILLPVLVSLVVVVALFVIILFCLRKQNILSSSNIEVSTFDRISCNSNLNSKCDSGVDGVPLTDYHCVSKLKILDNEGRSSLSYYSSPSRKVLGTDTTAIKTHSSDSHHEYAEPFMRLEPNRALHDQYACAVVPSIDKVTFQPKAQHYASIKKNKFTRPTKMMG